MHNYSKQFAYSCSNLSQKFDNNIKFSHYSLTGNISLRWILSTFLVAREQYNKHKYHMQEHDLGGVAGGWWRFFITQLPLNCTELQSLVFCNFVWESLANLHFFHQHPRQKKEDQEEEDNFNHHHPSCLPVPTMSLCSSPAQNQAPVPYQLLLGARKWRKEGYIAIYKKHLMLLLFFHIIRLLRRPSDHFSSPCAAAPRRAAWALAFRFITHSLTPSFSPAVSIVWLWEDILAGHAKRPFKNQKQIGSDEKKKWIVHNLMSSDWVNLQLLLQQEVGETFAQLI